MLVACSQGAVSFFPWKWSQLIFLIVHVLADPFLPLRRISSGFSLVWRRLFSFYLCYSLKCLKIVGGDNSPKTDQDLWEYMKSIKPTFPYFYKAYSHLRKKNWVVRIGSQYGVDFVAYRHHPALDHSEYAVLVSSEVDNSVNGRLRVWSDYYCTIRLCGSVVKTLLVLHINTINNYFVYPSCLEAYTVEERTIRRWSPEQCREDQDQTVIANGTHMNFEVDNLIPLGFNISHSQ